MCDPWTCTCRAFQRIVTEPLRASRGKSMVRKRDSAQPIGNQEELIMQTIHARTVASLVATIAASGVLADVRLTNDFPGGGYTSTYTLATGIPYTDATST